MTNLFNLFLATRPAFLVITILGCLLGLLIPQNHLAPSYLATLSIVVAVTAHAGANLLNDYFDHRNGSDAINVKRISPFTGGSRFIQDKTLTPSAIFRLALTLLFFSIVAGIYICFETTWLLVPIGAVGILIAWAYSAPPLELMSKGILGELAIAIAWSLIVIGFATLDANEIPRGTIPIGIAYGLMVSNILLINQIPDVDADAQVNKNTLATQFSIKGLNYWYTGIYLTAYLCQIFAVYDGAVSSNTLLTLLLMPAFLSCTRILNDAELARDKLKSLIIRNLVSVHAYAALMCLCLIKRT